MTNYRRVFIKGGTYFFTVVTNGRSTIFDSEPGISALNEAFETVIKENPFSLEAWAFLPDHLHCVWILPDTDSDFSLRWRKIKSLFTRKFLAGGGKESELSTSQKKRGERGIWQRRFWEHMIRDELDLSRHLDYIHFNPVKHGYVDCPIDWKHSSFSKFVKTEWYHTRWGETEPNSVDQLGAVGEP